MNLESFSQKISEGVRILSLSKLSSSQVEKLYLFQQTLLKWNKKINLTAHREELESLEKNFLDCLTLVPLIPPNKNVLDIGSGGGFPGLVLKIMIPEIEISLLEANQKKSSFLNYVIQELSLKNVQVVTKRLEEIKTDPNFDYQFDSIVSRATISSEKLLPIVPNFMKQNGRVLCMIGKSDFDLSEIFDQFKLEEKYFYKLPFSKSERGVFVFRLTSPRPSPL